MIILLLIDLVLADYLVSGFLAYGMANYEEMATWHGKSYDEFSRHSIYWAMDYYRGYLFNYLLGGPILLVMVYLAVHKIGLRYF